MSSYTTKQTPLSASNFIAYGIMASQFVSGVAIANEAEYPQLVIQSQPYETTANPSSYDLAGINYVTTFPEQVDKQFMNTVTNLYAQLLENKEALGVPFEKVLHDNLWDLYEE